MSPAKSATSTDQFATFGELLKFLRRRAGLTQLELSIAVGCSGPQISRLERNHRRPDLATLNARIIPALKLEAEPEITARLRALAASDAALPAPATIQTHSQGNLPLALTSFIGRETESGQLERLISVGRLVTLTGPGGVGKTRMALQGAAGLRPEFPDGVWLVELAPISNPGLVQTAVENVLGVRGSAGSTTLLDYLRAKNLLLVLDNCEHLLAACAQLAELLLQSCPGLKILATSREVLGVAGERISPVPSLALPAADQAHVVERLARVEAVRLFVERAAAVRPGFELNAQNAAAIAEVCTRLDGLPLAIELAAARVPILTVPQIARRLDDRFRLLTTHRRGGAARHQTLVALIDWSYDLLIEAERRLLQRLSVFAGGWTLEAAEGVCANSNAHPDAGDIRPGEVLPLLGLLASKSLILAEPGTGGAMRYRLLETIRQYARERLLETGPAELIQDRHFEYFRQMAARAELELRGPRKLESFSELGAEHDNLRAAMDWGLSRAEYGEVSLRLASGLLAFWSQRGHVSEGRAWLDRALASTHAPAAGAARAAALYAAAYLTRIQGETVAARTMLEASADLWRSLGPAGENGLAYALATLGEALRRLGDPAAGLAVASEAAALFRAHDDRWGLAYALSTLAIAIRDQDEFALARSIMNESMDLWRELDDLWGLAQATNNMAEVALREGDYALALRRYGESVAMARKLGDGEGLALTLEGLGTAYLNLGDRSRAKTYIEESFNLSRSSGNKTRVAICSYYFGYLAYFEGDIPLAQSFFEQELALVRTTWPLWLRSQALDGLAAVAAARGQPRRAARLLGAAETQLAAGASYVDAADRLFQRHIVNSIVAEIGEAELAVLRTDGRAMTFEQAAAYALETTNEAGGTPGSGTPST